MSALVLACFAPTSAGCLSNEYVIPPSELVRLSRVPAARRADHVRVVQDLGSRRGAALPPSSGPLAPTVEPPAGEAGGDGDVDADLDLEIDGGGRDKWSARRGGPRVSGASPRVHPPSGGWRGAVSPAPGHARAVPLGGLGGGGGRDDLVALAVVAVVIGVVAGVSLAAGEGCRFDGFARMAPEQPIHVTLPDRHDVVVPLFAITPEGAALAVHASVMDDEGYGLLRLEGLPLDRRGGVFRLDVGATSFGLGQNVITGPIAHLQVGYFFTRRFGLLATAAFSGGAAAAATTITRHALGIEADALPLAFGPLHVGGYAEAGLALAGVAGSDQPAAGPGFGSGALVELDLTSRMALALRAGADLARFDLGTGWSPAGTLAMGISVY